ncbi:MAG: hypothetical protein ACTSRW_13735 [Candidatus Helarchaeota archaeon]
MVMIDLFGLLNDFLFRFYFWSMFCVFLVNIGLIVGFFVAAYSAIGHGNWRAFRSLPSFLILLGMNWFVYAWLFGDFVPVFSVFYGIFWFFTNFP